MVLARLSLPETLQVLCEVISDEDAERPGTQCNICDKTLPDARMLAVHLARKHAVEAPATHVAYGTRCEVCGLEFWASDRLRVHLRRNPQCFAVYDHGDQARDPDTEVVDRLAHASRPAVRTPGPQPSWWAQLHPG